MELKKSANPIAMAARQAMLDPTVNTLFQRMKDELEATKQKLKQSQEDLSAATFTRERSSSSLLIGY